MLPMSPLESFFSLTFSPSQICYTFFYSFILFFYILGYEKYTGMALMSAFLWKLLLAFVYMQVLASCACFTISTHYWFALDRPGHSLGTTKAYKVLLSFAAVLIHQQWKITLSYRKFHRLYHSTLLCDM